MTKISDVAIIMSEKDNTAIAKKDIKKGIVIGKKLKILDFISQGHRFALADIPKGKTVKQYGYSFGLSTGIKKGEIISKHNVRNYIFNYETAVKKIFNKPRININKRKCEHIDKTFLGYKRFDGQIGTRNFYLVVPTSLCASDVASKIAVSLDTNEFLKKKYKNIDGIVAAVHTEGCGCNDGEIIDRLLLTLRNTIAHPNVGGILIIDLGCEKTNKQLISKYLGNLQIYKKPIDFLSIQDLGGTTKSIIAGKNIILKKLKRVNNITRQKVFINNLVVGTECGASDTFSGITANPLIGNVVDKIISSGGSAILSEMPEMVGAEINLIKRMQTKKVAKKFIAGMNYYKDLAEKLGVSLKGNFVPGNEKGGLVNLTLKSLGAILKGGSSEIVDFVNYAERIKKNGLSIMNGPGNDLESMTGIVASGANIILFSTGIGATEGNLITPVIKISSRTELYKKMNDDIDFDAGQLLKKETTADKVSDKLLDLVIDTASGKKTKAEILKKRSFQIWSAGKLSL
ncbi:MAG: UxaA family hydrolase [Elusimicrobiota bacterium]